MSEKQTIGGIASKPVLSEKDKTVKEPVIRTMQKDIDSLRGHSSIEAPQNLPVAKESAEKAKAESQRKLRALKIIAFKAWLKANSPVILKSSLVGMVIVLAAGIVGGFFYWWNYLRIIAPPVEVAHYQCQDFQCVSVEGEGADQCQTEQDCQPAEPEIPQSLILISKTEIIEIEPEDSELFIQGLKLILAKDGEKGIFDNILIKIVSRTEKKYADLSDFLSLLRLNLPKKIIQLAVADELGEANYTFFLYNQIEGKRLGLVIKITEEADLKEGLKEWEGNILEDISALFINLDDKTLLAAVEEFQDNIYNGVAIRYLNLPNPDLTIDYAIIGDKLIITTSKESMYAAIDGLLSVAE